MNTILITGNTYPVKDSIKALGGRWDAVAKGWRVPESMAAEAQALVAGAPKSSPARRSNGGGGVWNPDRFNGYGRKRGGYSKRCVSGGNCSSIGSGKCCGGIDCDGY